MINALSFAKSASRTSQLGLPSIFRRHKSITAAIERGRSGTRFAGRRSKDSRRKGDSFGTGQRKNKDYTQELAELSAAGRKTEPRRQQLSNLAEAGKRTGSWRGSRQQSDTGSPARDRHRKNSFEAEQSRKRETPQNDGDLDVTPWENIMRDQSDTGRRPPERAPRKQGTGRDGDTRRSSTQESNTSELGFQARHSPDSGQEAKAWRGSREESDAGRRPFERRERPRDTERKTDAWRGGRQESDRGRQTIERAQRPYDRERKGKAWTGGRQDSDTGRHTPERTQRPYDTERKPETWRGSRQEPNTGSQGREQLRRFQEATSNRANTTSTDRTPPRPESFPYTTAASEFLYGYSAVLAAIKARRRRLYNLYLHDRAMKHEGRIALVVRARQANIPIHEVDDSYLPLMDKASSGRPHNGFILEASPLPRPPITALTTSSMDAGYFTAPLDTQTREDLAINGTQTQHSYPSSGLRHPFLLYVDGVLDEGNLGNIIRSAYFLGVDGIATPTRNTAPMSHVTLKASAGAAEAIPLFTVADPAGFLTKSAQAGWRIYASDALPRPAERVSAVSPATSSNTDNSSNIVFSYAQSTRFLEEHSPLQQHPTILMMGGEGTGLRPSLVNHAHYKVGIRAARSVDEIGVDSLNVSTAAAMLCFEILKKPKGVKKAGSLLF